MLTGLLPLSVRVAEHFGDPDGGVLLPAERTSLGRVGTLRRHEFTMARTCARRAMADLGERPRPLLPGRTGAPRWPSGVAGSLTHCAGYVAAAVVHRSDLRSVGVDAEPHRPLPRGVLARVTDAGERALLAMLPAGTAWDTVLFSAKESVFKAWHPIMRGELGFHDATLTIDPLAATFTARLAVPGPPVLTGRFAVGAGLVVTALTVPYPTHRTGSR